MELRSLESKILQTVENDREDLRWRREGQKNTLCKTAKDYAKTRQTITILNPDSLFHRLDTLGANEKGDRPRARSLLRVTSCSGPVHSC